MRNKYFVNITADLDLKRDSETLSDTSVSIHQSILKTQEVFDTPDIFSFHEVSEDNVRQKVLRLDSTNPPVGDISVRYPRLYSNKSCSLVFKK